jgi:hypothetical protein
MHAMYALCACTCACKCVDHAPLLTLACAPPPLLTITLRTRRLRSHTHTHAHVHATRFVTGPALGQQHRWRHRRGGELTDILCLIYYALHTRPRVSHHTVNFKWCDGAVAAPATHEQRCPGPRFADYSTAAPLFCHVHCRRRRCLIAACTDSDRPLRCRRNGALAAAAAAAA